MHLDELTNILNEALPLDSALDGDKVGLQIEAEGNIKKALICLEITDDVVSEATEKDCQLIIAFHPLIFNPLSEIRQNERVGRLSSKLIRAGISVYVVHTSFDVFEEGTSKIIAEKLGLLGQQFLLPSSDYENKGMGILGEFKGNEAELLEICSKIFNSPLKFNANGNGSVQKVGIIGGSGSSFIVKILRMDVDVLITADITYHVFHRVDGNMKLIDPGHYEMEQFVPHGIKKLTDDLELDIDFVLSEVHTNPVRYYPALDFTIRQKNYLKL